MDKAVADASGVALLIIAGVAVNDPAEVSQL